MTRDEEARATLSFDVARSVAQDVAEICGRLGLGEMSDVVTVLGTAHAIAIAHCVDTGADRTTCLQVAEKLIATVVNDLAKTGKAN